MRVIAVATIVACCWMILMRLWLNASLILRLFIGTPILHRQGRNLILLRNREGAARVTTPHHSTAVLTKTRKDFANGIIIKRRFRGEVAPVVRRLSLFARS